MHALHFHPPCRALPAAEELLLSASADWSAKLWSRADGDAAGALATFEHTPDALLDARWSPRHPALFATADAAGCVALWNIAADTERPVAHAAATADGRGCARLCWAPDGRTVAVADSAGALHLQRVDEDIAEPRADDVRALAEAVAVTGAAGAEEGHDYYQVGLECSRECVYHTAAWCDFHRRRQMAS